MELYRLGPITETISVMLRVASHHRDEGEKEEDADKQDLAPSQPELCFAKVLDNQHVACSEGLIVSITEVLTTKIGTLRVEDDACRDDCSGGDIVTPKGQEHIQRRNLKRNEQRLKEKEIPADHKAPGIVNPGPGVMDKRCTDWHEDSHLRQRVVDLGNYAGLQSKCYQQAACSTHKTIPDANEKGRSDRASDCHELDLAWSEMALQVFGIVDNLAASHFTRAAVFLQLSHLCGQL